MLIDDAIASINLRRLTRKRYNWTWLSEYWERLVIKSPFVKLDFKEVSNNSSGSYARLVEWGRRVKSCWSGLESDAAGESDERHWSINGWRSYGRAASTRRIVSGRRTDGPRRVNDMMDRISVHPQVSCFMCCECLRMCFGHQCYYLARWQPTVLCLVACARNFVCFSATLRENGCSYRHETFRIARQRYWDLPATKPCRLKINPLIATLKPQSNRPSYSLAIQWLVHWPLMGGLLHLVQRWGNWAEPQPVQAPPRCTKCNSPPINGQCTNFVLFDVAL